MTHRRPAGPRFALPELAARFVVFVSLAGVVELLVGTFGLRFVVTGLLGPPAAVLLAWHWPYAAGNRFVLAAAAPLLAYIAFALLHGSSENTEGLLPVYLFNCLLLALVAAHVARSSGVAVRGLIGVARIALLISVASILFGSFDPPTGYGSDVFRFDGFFWNPNEAAMASVLLLNFVLYRPWNQRLLNWFAVAVAPAATFLTLSKTGAALLLVSLLLFLWIRRQWVVLAVVPVAALLVLSSARPILDAYEEQIVEVFITDRYRQEWQEGRQQSEQPLTGSARDRIDDAVDFFSGEFTTSALGPRGILWSLGIARIRDTFPHGSGFGSFHALEGGVFAAQISHPVFGRGQWHGVHNMYLMVAGEAGFVVFALLVFCHGWLLARAWLSSRDDGLPFAIIAVTLIGWSATHNFLGNRYYVVAFAVAVGLLARRAPAAHGARTD